MTFEESSNLLSNYVLDAGYAAQPNKWYLWGYQNGRGWRPFKSPSFFSSMSSDDITKYTVFFEMGVADGKGDKDD